MKKILVADDKPSSRELILTLLEHSGYEILEAAGRAAYIRFLDQHTSDRRAAELEGYLENT